MFQFTILGPQLGDLDGVLCRDGSGGGGIVAVYLGETALDVTLNAGDAIF